MITELDESKGRVDEVIRETERSIRDAKARGATTRLLSFEDMFKRILDNAKKDPRIDTKAQGALFEYAEKAYKKLAKAEGFSEHVITDASVLRGHVVHVLLKVKSGEILEMTPYADERIAIATFNDWAKAEGESFTAQEIRIFEAKDDAEEKEHPLYLSNHFGSGVRTCPIR
jgi:hypothetical protein